MADKMAEVCLNTWRERLTTSYNNKDLTSADVCSLFRHHVRPGSLEVFTLYYY
jgi:hypothetical protein